MLRKLPAFERPWEECTLADARKEFPQSDDPLLEYLKHRARFHEGEVALVWEKWEPSGGELPRDAMLWHPQFARNHSQARTMRGLPLNHNKGEIDEIVDLRKKVGDTTIVSWPEGSDGPCLLRGGALTLPMLWKIFGLRFTAQELLFYYLNCPKVASKRPHAWGSHAVRTAALDRKRNTGRWGHNRTRQ